MRFFAASAFCLSIMAAGCATSAQEQRQAEQHQFNSDQAAKQGQFKRAEDEQREAADAHHRAVIKAIDESQPIPPQTEKGIANPDGGR